jgi:hypothetical protein
MQGSVIEWIRVDTEPSPDAICHDNIGRIILVIRFKAEVMDLMAKIVSLSVTSKVGNQVVRMHVVRLERTSRTHVQIGCDLFDANAARDITALVHLVLDAVGPVFGDALFDGVGV